MAGPTARAGADGTADERGAEIEAGRDVARGKDPAAGEREYRIDDEDPSAHRCDRKGQDDRRRTQDLVHAVLQAAVLPQRLSADLQSAQRPSRSYASQ